MRYILLTLMLLAALIVPSVASAHVPAQPSGTDTNFTTHPAGQVFGQSTYARAVANVNLSEFNWGCWRVTDQTTGHMKCTIHIVGNSKATGAAINQTWVKETWLVVIQCHDVLDAHIANCHPSHPQDVAEVIDSCPQHAANSSYNSPPYQEQWFLSPSTGTYYCLGWD